MKTVGIALLKQISFLQSGTPLVVMSLLCGKDSSDKTRYLNGSFIFNAKKLNIVDVEHALKMANGDEVLVEYEIADLHCEVNTSGSGHNAKTYLNYRGFLRGIKLHKKAEAN